MAFETRLDYSDNRQVKQFQFSNTQLSGTTTFGVPDVYVPMGIDAINVDALQNIRTVGLIFPNSIPAFTGSTYQLLGRDDASGKVVEVTGISGGTSGGTNNTDDYTTGSTFNTTNGLLDFTRQSGSTYNVNLDGRYLNSSGYTAPTGLEAIDEGNGKTWRLIGEDPAKYGNGGLNSVDAQANDQYAGSGYGIQSAGGFAAGGGNTLSTGGTTNFGTHIAIGSTNTVYGYFNNMAFGTRNSVTEGYSVIALGYENDVQTTNTVGQGLASGTKNKLRNYWVSAIGTGIISNSVGGLAVGISNVEYSGSSGASDRPMFTVGNGTASTSTNPLLYGERGTVSDAFMVKHNGELSAPSYGSGTFTGTSTYVLGVDVDGKIIEEPLSGSGSTPSLQAVTDVGNTTTLDIAAASFNDLELFYTVATTRIGIGENALEFNSATDVLGIGFQAGRNNTQGTTTLIGTYAGEYNVSSAATLVGNAAGRYSNGTSNTVGVGNSALLNNQGAGCTGVGVGAGSRNTEDDLTAIGYNSSNFNQGVDNTSLGNNTNTTFNDDGANLKNVAVAATDVDTALERITITTHGFGGNGTYVNLRYTTTGTAIGGIFHNSIYQFLIVDANTLEVTQGVNFSSTGTDTHTFTPQFAYENITVLGANTQPTKSNQVVLGDANVTEVYTDGHIKTHKEVVVDTTTSYAFVLADRNSIITLNNAGATTAILPAEASIDYPIGTEITMINLGAGTVTVSVTTDTLNQNVGGLTMAQYDKRVATKVASATWILS